MILSLLRLIIMWLSERTSNSITRSQQALSTSQSSCPPRPTDDRYSKHDCFKHDECQQVNKTAHKIKAVKHACNYTYTHCMQSYNYLSVYRSFPVGNTKHLQLYSLISCVTTATAALVPVDCCWRNKSSHVCVCMYGGV